MDVAQFSCVAETEVGIMEVLVSSSFFSVPKMLKDLSVSSDSEKLPALSSRQAWSQPHLCCCHICQQKQTHHLFGSLREFLQENCPVPLLQAGSLALVISVEIWTEKSQKP